MDAVAFEVFVWFLLASLLAVFVYLLGITLRLFLRGRRGL